MKLIIGLGNPEARYDGTRHNVGFAALDYIAEQFNVKFQPKTKFQALVAEARIGNDKVLLVKPTGYYNLSGKTVRSLLDFYKLTPADVLVIHDELALPLGVVRTRIGGSDAGNNGVKSITEHVGEDTTRVRVGVYSPLRDQMDDADFVLSKFNASEREIIAKARHIVAGCVEDFIYSQLAPTTHQAD